MRNALRDIYRSLLPLLYARRQYRFFLKTGMAELEQRARLLAVATDFFGEAVRPVVLEAPFGRSALVLAPHQDDEVIGCGGALALQVRAGRPAHVLILQDGADEHDKFGLSRSALTEQRNEESRQAARRLDLTPEFLNYENLRRAAPQAIERVAGIIQERQVDAIFAPFVLDPHPDHRVVNQILAAALKRASGNPRVFGYEVWGLCVPSVVVKIDAVVDVKREMLGCFARANQAVDYVQRTLGLNMYRASFLGAGQSRYAECFFESPGRELVSLVERLEGPLTP